MGIFKRLPEKFLMQLTEPWHLQPASGPACQLAVVDGNDTRVNLGRGKQLFSRKSLPDQFCAENINVKFNVVADEYGCLVQVGSKRGEDFAERPAFFRGSECRNPVNLFGFEGDVKSLGFNNMRMLRKESAFLIV